METPQRIFIAALNWGLGHATRCIPLIRKYQAEGAQVTLASDGAAGKLLQAEFPDLAYHELPGYEIQYPKKAAHMMAAMLSQMPKMTARIQQEHKWLVTFLTDNPQDLIISDNRYGLYHADVESVIVCHQLSIPLNRMKGLVEGLHKRMLERFDVCWVPDDESRSLSGDLSRLELSIPLRFIGPLSRFEIKPSAFEPIKVLAILSGVEPQRSQLEEALAPTLSATEGAMLIRGLMHVQHVKQLGSMRVYGHVLADQLEAMINAADLVICRSGYSSVMDLVALKKKAILIPTPGQPEQEYLSEYLSSREQFTCLPQDKISEDLLTTLLTHG